MAQNWIDRKSDRNISRYKETFLLGQVRVYYRGHNRVNSGPIWNISRCIFRHFTFRYTW